MNDTALQLMDPPQLPGANGDAAPCVEPDSLPKSRCGHARTGKIAHLPKAIRDRLDQMLEDGFTCDQIKDTLGDPVRHLTPNNFTEWRKGGHLDYLKDKFWRQEMRLRQEAYTDMVEGADPVKLPEAGLQVSTTSICELLRDLCEADADNQKTRVEKHVRLANAMSRLARSILQLQQYREDCARNKSLELKQRDINEDLSNNEFELVTARMDRVFRMPRKKPNTEPGTAVAPALPPAPEPSAAELAAPACQPKLERRLEPSEGGLAAPEPSEVGLAAPKRSVGGETNPNAEPALDLTKGAHAIPSDETNCASSLSPSDASSLSPSDGERVGVRGCPVPAHSPNPDPGLASTGTAPAALNTPPLQHSITPLPLIEHCLQCNSPLPALRPTGGRPRQRCDHCNIELPPPGSCVEPSIERCPQCRANLPRLLPTGERPLYYCHRCSTDLPTPAPATCNPATCNLT